MKYTYQYNVVNKHMNFIISSPVEDKEYSKNLARRAAMDFYGYTKEQVEYLEVKLICKFWGESVINVKELI